MKTKNSILIAVALICFSLSGYATHLMGGNMTYTYVSYNATTNLYSYLVTLHEYRYCSDSNSAQLTNSEQLGIYYQDPTNLNGPKALQAAVTIPRISLTNIVPPSSNPNCTTGANVCVQEGIYRVTIQVPPSTGGYHLIMDRCCRNGNISNIVVLVGGMTATGENYYAFIPPTAYQNNSPTFATAAVPYICAADTISILNAAFDVDGDSLVYSFQVPYKGPSSSGAPQPNPPAIYTWPISTVTYNAGYSVTNPFGAGGYASINSATGLTSYYVPNTGFYVVAVEIKEYRNGALIGITRRDLQLIVIACPPNTAPSFASATSGQTVQTVSAGTNLCFNVTFNDAGGDSVSLSSTGLIFDNTFVSPAATFPHTKGLGTTTSQFCWTTPCERNTQGTYQFVATGTDNGCPPKTTNIVYTIHVNPNLISSIVGFDTVCVNEGAAPYAVSSSTATSYNWTITGGNQTSGGTTGSIHVNWTSPSGSVAVYGINSNGCHSDTALKAVTTYNPLATAGPDALFCSGGSATLGGSPVANQIYHWSPSSGLSDSTIANPLVTLNNAGLSPLTVRYIVTATQQSCIAADTVLVVVNPAPVVSLAPFNSTCINAASFSLGGGLPAGGTYSGAGVSGNSFNPSLAGVGPHVITYSYTNNFGCTKTAGSTINVAALPVVNLNLSFSTACINGAPVTLSGGSPAGGTYSGAGVSGGVFTPSVAGSGLTTITYSYTDVNGCSATSSSTVNISMLPTVSFTLPVNHLCINDAPATLSGGTPAGGAYSGAGVSNGMFDPASAGTGPHPITYSYSDPNGCAASSSSTMNVNQLPAVSLALTSSQVCTNASPITLSGGTPAGGTYNGAGVSGNMFDPVVAGQGPHTITYSFTSASGCSNSATSTLTVEPLPSVTLTLGTACVGAAPFVLTGGSPPGGTYSGPGVSGGMFDPTVAGFGPHTISYTYANAAGCASTVTGTITVGTLPAPSVSVSPGIGCQDHTIYIGYGPQSLTLTATNAGVVTYQWYKDGVAIPGATSSTLQVTTAGVYYVIASDAGGCTSAASSPQAIATINTVDVRCGQNLSKVILCHVPPGNSGNPQTLCIAPAAVPAHLAGHPGDCLGPCTVRVSSSQKEVNAENQLAVYPNPFFLATNVDFEVFETSNVFVGLYDLEGRLVQALFDGVADEGTAYQVQCNGAQLSQGVYFIKLTAGNLVNYQKLIKF